MEILPFLPQWNIWCKNDSFLIYIVDTLLQIPRLYNVYKGMGIVTSFQNLLDNIFLPLFEVTIDPASHPQLHVFLKQVEKSLVIKNMHIDCSSALCHASTFHTSTIYLLLCASHMPVFFLLDAYHYIKKKGEKTLTNTPKTHTKSTKNTKKMTSTLSHIGSRRAR